MLLAAAIAALPQTASAFCWGTIALNPDQPRYQTTAEYPYQFTQSTSFWAVVAAMPFDPGDDGDVELYSTQNTFSGPQPYCLQGYITGSTNGAGRTDFVIGDFNFNSPGTYYPRVWCYSGTCTPESGPQWNGVVWRPGEFLFVDFPPTTVSFGGGNPVPGDRIIKVFDVFLSAGSTYYFRFASDMGTDAKMLLFRNTGGGTYFAGRNAAQFEVTGCTSYSAPTTGYYGLVVVLDRWTTGSYTVGVTTVPSCACAVPLVSSIQVAVPSTLAEHRSSAQPQQNFWNAIGVRAPVGNDWDLEVGDGYAGGEGPACQSNVLASSTSGFGADIVVADYNFVSVPANLAVHAVRYSGGSGASLEWDTSSNALGESLVPNGPQVAEAWAASDVVKIWDALLVQGTPYTFQFYNPGGNFRVLLYRNPGNGAYYAGRSQAVINTTADFNYTPPSSGYYGVAVIKDDDNAGTFALRIGTCPAPNVLSPLTSMFPAPNMSYAEFTPAPGSWNAVGVRSTTADWDLFQYGTASGAPWPDCYSPLLVSSEASSGQDFVVGDFHFNPAGTYRVRAKQFSSGQPEFALLTWTGSAMKLLQNAPPAPDTLPWHHTLHAWEAYLINGAPYELRLVQPAGGSLHAYVFVNPVSGPYWAPKSARLTETGGTVSFVAPLRGWYGIVVADDNMLDTPYTLQIVTTPTAVGDPTPRYETGLSGVVPNPARSDFAIHYTLARPAHVGIQIVDLSGRRVAEVDEGVRNAGEWSLEVSRRSKDGTRLPAGIYFARMSVDGRIAATRKISVLD